MKKWLTILVLVLAGSALASAFDLRWNAPTNGNPQGYVITHWAPGALVEQYGVGNVTNFSWQGSLVDGVNYFAVSDYEVRDGELIMSAFSNVASVTNTAALLVDYYLFTSTNLNGGWTPAQTNYVLLFPSADSLFLQAGGARIHRTNLVTFQPMP